MTTQPNINGVTLKDVTRIMRNTEKIIQWYNKKYAFDISQASQQDQKKYESLLRTWDFLKSKRDELKAAA